MDLNLMNLVSYLERNVERERENLMRALAVLNVESNRAALAVGRGERMFTMMSGGTGMADRAAEVERVNALLEAHAQTLAVVRNQNNLDACACGTTLAPSGSAVCVERALCNLHDDSVHVAA